jgi:hypothetical protein
MSYSMHRPMGYRGQADSHLSGIVRQLRRVLVDTQRNFAYDTFVLPANAVGELAGLLVDFAEDLHNGAQTWGAYERYNVDFFGTTLPLVSPEGDGEPRAGFHSDRLRHFLWVVYPMIFDGLTISPNHQDLHRLADVSSDFLADAFSGVPKDSGVKAFLQTSNEHGWDVKRKLLWLGTHSFMFRTAFAGYVARRTRGESLIACTDDFVCQECTKWSGLGAIDILAKVLDVSNDDRSDLRNWYERHSAFYRIMSVSDDTLKAMNLVNDEPYKIRINLQRNPFKPGQVLFGSLVPWRGEWYWSGEQRLLGDAASIDVRDLVKTMKRQVPGIVCRYSKEYRAQVKQSMSDIHEKMLAYNSKDLTVYPDGLSMAADWQTELQRNWESRPKQEVAKAIKKHGLTKGRPDINLPKELLEAKDGIGVFLNPDEGKEIMTHFVPLVAGLEKKGMDLTEDEDEAILGFIESAAVSPRFVRRVLEKHGDESVRTTFLLKGELPAYWLDYLLRSHKGHFYRRRYPTLSVV